MKLSKIREAVSDRFEIDISKKDKYDNYVKARAVYYKLARKLTKKSFEEIALEVNRIHATALHGLKVFEQMEFYNDEYYMKEYKSLIAELVNVVDNDEVSDNENLHIEKYRLACEKYQELLNDFNEFAKTFNKMKKITAAYQPLILERKEFQINIDKYKLNL